MKKAIKLTAAVVLVAVLLTGAWALGRMEGVRHAMEDSQVWILDRGITGSRDIDVSIELDGDCYAHKCRIG